MLKQFDRKAQSMDNLLMISEKMPFQYVEAYRSLRTNIQFASVNTAYKKIMVTSSISGEGKSTVAVNLAATFAKMDCKVLLVDSDLRKPVLGRFFDLESAPKGLSTAITEVYKPEDCINYIESLNIYLMPSGPIPPNPAEMIGSEKMARLLEQFSEDFDYILFDTPPASVVTDAAVLSKFVDGVVFIIRQNYTAIDTAQSAINSLKNVGANIIGGVMNNFETKRSSRYYKHKELYYKNA